MKSAYLILAHKNPAFLHRLINAINSDNNIFLIHIDNKTAIRPFIKYFENFPPGKVFFCPERYNVQWGTYSMVEATMALIRFLFYMEIQFDYAHLISGQDYPIKSSIDLETFLKKNEGKNFLHYYTFPNKDLTDNGLNRYENLWGLNENNYFGFNDLEYKRKRQPSHRLPSNIIPYGGAQWWSLHKLCLNFILNEFINGNILFEFFRYTLIPDEMIFQTLILNSNFKSTVINNNIRFTEWVLGTAHPITLTSDYLDKLNIEDKFFARKFDMHIDENVLEQLDFRRNFSNSIKLRNPIKRKKKKWCVISAVGRESLHRRWISKTQMFDLHLMIYDDSYENYKKDTKFIFQSKGYKFNLLYEYLIKNPHIIEQYDYFYIPDDDIATNCNEIHRLFYYMVNYNLDIAQPAITNDYFSYPHTFRRNNSILRYTNFVEVMQPCFSKEALKKVLFTFKENYSGWGIDFHWGYIINFECYNMAIIDDIMTIHSRPVRTSFKNDLDAYIAKFNLDMNIIELL